MRPQTREKAVQTACFPERGGGVLTLIGLQVKIRVVASGQTGPVIVISSDAIGTLPIRLVARLMSWNDNFTGNGCCSRVLRDYAARCD